ncbi:hypothetical protein GQ457_07G016940 [Hibiscus cannabinus]
MVVIQSLSPMIIDSCLCYAVMRSDCGCYERYGNNGSLSTVEDLSLARPLLDLVKPIQNSLVKQELIELVMTRPSVEGACLRMELSHRLDFVRLIVLGVSSVSCFSFFQSTLLCLVPLVNLVVGFYLCLAWPMISFISYVPSIVEFVVNPSGFYQGQCPCLFLNFCMV